MIVRVSRYALALIGLALLIPITGMLGQADPDRHPSSKADSSIPPIQSITLPPEYREWKLISVAHEAGKLNDLRAILGNDIAYKAARNGIVPFPDGAAIARVAWVYASSEGNDKAFGQNQSFVPGAPTNVQLLLKDSRKFSATGGWGFAQFSKGNAANEAIAKDCFGCHLLVKPRDHVFTRYAP